VLTGDHIHIDGYNTGGLFGNGNAWYDAEQAVTQPVRPMNFVWWNASEGFLENCKPLFLLSFDIIERKELIELDQIVWAIDPPLWSINLMNITNAWFNNIYVNATAANAPYGVL
jgi:galacturan 1,4-alpha-galacturonidase